MTNKDKDKKKKKKEKVLINGNLYNSQEEYLKEIRTKRENPNFKADALRKKLNLQLKAGDSGEAPGMGIVRREDVVKRLDSLNKATPIVPMKHGGKTKNFRNNPQHD
tara:strand:+ start:83 stop:403 length:321 start_codon:yes stop_codon:yes gene_type:complete